MNIYIYINLHTAPAVLGHKNVRAAESVVAADCHIDIYIYIYTCIHIYIYIYIYMYI